MRSVVVGLIAVLFATSQLGAAAASASDIVAPGSGLTLGSGWYLHEEFGGDGFRWVDNDAQFVVHRPSGSIKKVTIVAEAGPGLGVTKFPLEILDRAGRPVAQADFDGKQGQRFDLPVLAGQDAVFKLHVSGGGKKVANDRRTLNFRVFEIEDASRDASLGAGHPDIAAGTPDVRLGDNWFPLEEYKGETFRWIDNDARFSINSEREQSKRLKLVVAPGPGLAHPANFFVVLRDRNGHEVQRAGVKGGRETVYLNLPLQQGQNDFSLHVDGGGRHGSNGDPRILNFRIFSLSVA
jgi:hypothetical protein